MTDLVDEVRDTFRTVGSEVSVPSFDEVAFRGRVRRARRRRTHLAVAGVAVAAGVSGLALVTLPPLLEDGTGGPEVGTQPRLALSAEALPAPLYYTAGMRLMAATPDGEVHDLGFSEGVVGATAEGVLTTDQESALVWIGASSSGERDGAYTFRRGAGPVRLPDTGPVQSAALSADGRYVAWVDLEDQVTMWDLKADRLVYRAEVGRNAYVTSVSERGVLVSLNGNLALLGVRFDVDVPTARDGYGWLSDIAGRFVTVVDRDDVTRVYDVAEPGPEGGVAPLVDSVPGTGRLAPYARGVVSVDGSTVRVWPTDGDPHDLAGVAGTPQSAGWLDEDHVVVTSAETGGTAVYVCPLVDPSCVRVVFSQDDVRLAE